MFSTPSEDLFRGGARDDIELLKAWAGTSLAYAVYRAGAASLLGDTPGFLQELAIAAVVCGLGFVLHELAHRIVARRFGASAHFVADDRWLLISIAIAFVGFFVAAPGAVWHRGRLNAQQSGLIALAGPLANLGLALVFIAAFPVLWSAGLQADWVVILCLTGVSLNAWLGLFNMIPAGPFDGARVLAWSPVAFGVTVAVGFLLTFVVGTQQTLSMIWGSLLAG